MRDEQSRRLERRDLGHSNPTFFLLLVASVLQLVMLAVSATGSVGAAGGILTTGEETIEHPDKAVCRVCSARSTHGADPEAEKVAGFSIHQDSIYYFCSDPCKAEFDASPDWWVPLDLPFRVPERSVTSLEGEVVALNLGGDQLTLIDFWATWCVPCKKTMQELQERFERGGDGVRIVGISIDEGKDALKKVRRYVKRQEATYPVFLDNQEPSMWSALKVRAVPTMMLVDREGRVVWRYTGPDGEERLDEVLAQFQ